MRHTDFPFFVDMARHDTNFAFSWLLHQNKQNCANNGKTAVKRNVKSFPSLTTHRAALISVS